MPPKMTHEELLASFSHVTKREACLMLAKPHLLMLAYRQARVRLTSDRAIAVHEVLQAAARNSDIQNDVRPDLRDHLELCHTLAFLPYDEAAHYLQHPQCFIDYLGTQKPILSIIHHDLEDFRNVLQEIINAELGAY